MRQVVAPNTAPSVAANEAKHKPSPSGTTARVQSTSRDARCRATRPLADKRKTKQDLVPIGQGLRILDTDETQHHPSPIGFLLVPEKLISQTELRKHKVESACLLNYVPQPIRPASM